MPFGHFHDLPGGPMTLLIAEREQPQPLADQDRTEILP